MKQLLCCNHTGSFNSFFYNYLLISQETNAILIPKWSVSCDLVNLRLFHNQIKKYLKSRPTEIFIN